MSLGNPSNPATTNVLIEVRVERERQDEKWGEQNHDNGTWSLILGEEFGESCEAALDVRFKDNWTVEDHFASDNPEAMIASRKAEQVAHLRDELIQVAAVAVAWVENIDRRAA